MIRGWSGDKSLSICGERKRSIGLETGEQGRGDRFSVFMTGVHGNNVKGNGLVQPAKIVNGIPLGSPARGRDFRVFCTNLPLIAPVRPDGPDCEASLVIVTDKHQQAVGRRPVDVPYRPVNALKSNGALLPPQLVQKPDLPGKVARNHDGGAIRRPAGDKLTALYPAGSSAELRHDVHAVLS